MVLEQDESVISVSVAAPFRDQGYGSEIIRLGCLTLFMQTTVQAVHAYVREDNPTSLRAFAKAGFSLIGTMEIQGHLSVHSRLRVEDAHGAQA